MLADDGIVGILGGQHLIEGVFHLSFIRSKQCFKGRELARIADHGPHLLAAQHTAPTVQGQFQTLGQIEVAVCPGSA